MIDTSPWSSCSRRSPWLPWSSHKISSTGPSVSPFRDFSNVFCVFARWEQLRCFCSINHFFGFNIIGSSISTYADWFYSKQKCVFCVVLCICLSPFISPCISFFSLCISQCISLCICTSCLPPPHSAATDRTCWSIEATCATRQQTIDIEYIILEYCNFRFRFYC